MNNQGKRKEQVDFSESAVAISIVALIALTIISSIIG